MWGGCWATYWAEITGSRWVYYVVALLALNYHVRRVVAELDMRSLFPILKLGVVVLHFFVWTASGLNPTII